MKVALITMRPKIADKKANLEKMEKYIKKTKADMYVFGELTICGYHVKDELRDIAEPVNGPMINCVKKIAQKNKCYIVFGMPLKNSIVKGLIHNAAVLIHPNGKVYKYHWHHSPSSFYSPQVRNNG